MAVSWAAYGNASHNGPSVKDDDIFILPFLDVAPLHVNRHPKNQLHFPRVMTPSQSTLAVHGGQASREILFSPLCLNTVSTVPKTAKSMTFGQLVVDCFQQIASIPDNYEIEKFYLVRFAPLFTEQIEDKYGTTSAIADIPESLFLSDFVKLLYGPKFIFPQYRGLSIGGFQFWGYPVQVENAVGMKTSDAIPIVRQCAHTSKLLWMMSEYGELSELTGNSTSLEPSSILKLDDLNPQYRDNTQLALIQKTLFSDFRRVRKTVSDLDVSFEVLKPGVFLRMAALINCGLGVSAFRWSKHYLTPILVKFKSQCFLSLAPNCVVHEPGYAFWIVECHILSNSVKTRFGLVACNDNLKSHRLCLFPPDADVDVDL
jgi:hypothetical protein